MADVVIICHAFEEEEKRQREVDHMRRQIKDTEETLRGLAVLSLLILTFYWAWCADTRCQCMYVHRSIRGTKVMSQPLCCRKTCIAPTIHHLGAINECIFNPALVTCEQEAVMAPQQW
jgi:hypothetical protein